MKHDSETFDAESSFRAIGIAFVVDRVGKGASMVLRYPTSPLSEGVEDLFFKLPPRQMAKLFRPKPTLCGKPMTLSVGSTFFCCFATLMDESSQENGTTQTEKGQANEFSSPAASSNNDLILFSVIVALAPKRPSSSVPTTGWYEDSLTQSTGAHSATHNIGTGNSRSTSQSILSVRRVHLSLARLCRVLEREERRCKYVSSQTHQFHLTRQDLKSKWLRARPSSEDVGAAVSGASSTTNSPVSVASKGHRRHRSSSYIERSTNMSSEGSGTGGNSAFQNSEEFQQEYLDIIMADTYTRAASDTDDNTTKQYYHGNLARELVQVFHALGRNDISFPATPAALISGRRGIVFINRHLATFIEAVSSLDVTHGPKNLDSRSNVLPYHTILFPHASAEELLEALSLSSSGPPRTLHLLLQVIHPQKSLTDAAVEANIPLQLTLDLANYLIEQGACVASSVLLPSSRLVCRPVRILPKISLGFAQKFGDNIQVHHLLAYLTRNNRTFGSAMTAWRTSPDDTWIREKLEASALTMVNKRSTYIFRKDTGTNDLNPVEDLLFEMVVWLCANNVLVQLEEYLLVTTANAAIGRNTIVEGEDKDDFKHSERKTDSSLRLDKISDEYLFTEMFDAGLLNGKSLISCSWETRLDMQKLRAFALAHPQVRIAVRAPQHT
ncbi:hypothetical protein FisN_23Lh250 [Fistulifera solaris]|uniref:Nitrogen permease regulator 3 n=1 Tax=Fistulifera solaris TaxID=1519565 RepID=A0A1Z5JS77_FISSO|nr:hypothetical protein FisN_23Lh250 [Fistulifera solaris]|eukprot:GAX16621.1 hypothetical protein FisN_23Lh250 [Fistulifera solaris]